VQSHRLTVVIGLLYIACLAIFAFAIYLRLLTVQIGIGPFLFLFFILCFFYAFLFKWDRTFINKFFLIFILIGAIVKIILSFSDPLWEDDWARYLWEGQLLNEGISPYKVSPDSYYGKILNFTLTTASEEILSRINHPDWKAIYFPMVELYFYLGAVIEPYSLVILKLGYVPLDLLVCYLISKMRDKKSALLYFFFPVIFKEIYLNAHFEMICIFLLTAAIWYLQKQKLNLSAFLFGLAVHSKLFLLLLAPYFLMRYVQQTQWNLKIITERLLYFSVLFLIGFIFPFLLLQFLLPRNDSFGFEAVFAFANHFEFNSLLFHLLTFVTSIQVASFTIMVLMLAFLLLSIRHFERVLTDNRGNQWLFLCFLLYLLLTPIANPWYFLILTPFYFLSKPRLGSSWLLLLIPQLAYLTHTNLRIQQELGGDYGYYNLPEWVIFTELSCIFFVLILNYRKYSILLYILSNISNFCKKHSIHLWKIPAHKKK
jgi:hypothetical protein